MAKLTKHQNACRASAAIVESKISLAAKAVGINVTIDRGNLYIGRRPVKSAPTIRICIQDVIFETIYFGPKDDWTKVAIEPVDLPFFATWNPYTIAKARVWKDIDGFDFAGMLTEIKNRQKRPIAKDEGVPF